MNQYYEKNLTTGVVTTHYYSGSREVAYKNNGTLRFVHQDSLSSTSLTTDISGAIIASVKFYPFGVTRSATGTLDTDKLFTGQRLDDTGLYYYNARYYDATIGRFISPDTIVPNYMNPQTLNRYSYCLNNPLKYIDPSGHLNAEDHPASDGWHPVVVNGNTIGYERWGINGHYLSEAAIRRMGAAMCFAMQRGWTPPDIGTTTTFVPYGETGLEGHVTLAGQKISASITISPESLLQIRLCYQLTSDLGSIGTDIYVRIPVEDLNSLLNSDTITGINLNIKGSGVSVQNGYIIVKLGTGASAIPMPVSVDYTNPYCASWNILPSPLELYQQAFSPTAPIQGSWLNKICPPCYDIIYGR